MKKTKDKKTFYSQKRWNLAFCFSVAKSLTGKIIGSKQFSDEWHYYKVKKEIIHIKKHLILMEMLLDKFQKSKSFSGKGLNRATKQDINTLSTE